ncbi:zinc-dependent alcohol dehydrogenase [Microbacterium sp. MC2]
MSLPLPTTATHAAAPAATMSALVLEDYGRMVVAQRPVPVVGDGEVRVRVHGVGICGSDLHGFTGANGRRFPGQVMGHEAVGTVDAVGAGVTSFTGGERVVVNPTLACQACDWCARGQQHICPQRRVLGVDPTLSSAFAEFFVVPERNLIPFDGILLHGALVEPLAVGYHAARRAGVSAGDTVAVIGGGPIGQAAALACIRLGAARVIVGEPREARRRLLEDIGAETFDPFTASAPLGAGEADAAIDAVGASETILTALELTAPGGTVVLVGMDAPAVELQAYPLTTQERSLVGAFCYTAEEFAETAAWAATVPETLDRLIERAVPLDEGPAAFEELTDPERLAGKIIIEFPAKPESAGPPASS